MKQITRIALAALAAIAISLPAIGQDTGSSSSAVMRRGNRNARQQEQSPEVSARMQQRMQSDATSDADLSWMKVIYRTLDLTKDKNAPLYYPEMPVDGNESLFRIIMRLLANNQISAYEYLDGREVFNDENRVKVRDMLDRYHIYYQDAKGSSERNPKFEIHESDVPATEVLSYYIIERWEFDTRSNKMKTRIMAICPVLHRNDDYGMESLKYPMFWIKYDDLRPYLATQNIFTSDANNIPSGTYDDYFQLGLYEGEIYKTLNLRNRSMKQLYPNPDDLARAQDSIQRQLDTFEDKLWVPTLEQLAEQRERREALEAQKAELAEGADSTLVTEEKPKTRVSTTRRGKKSEKPVPKTKRGQKKSKAKAPKEQKSKSAPTRSVRNRKR